MHVPTEYIALAAVAAFLLIVLLILICCLCCRRSKVTGEPDGKVAIGFADERILIDNNPATDVATDGRVATPTELHAAGYSPTQLLDMHLVREATKSDLLEKGYTKSQLQTAGILPKRKKQKSLPASFKSKPLKPFKSEMDESRGKKRRANEDDDQDVTREPDRSKKKQPAANLFDDLFNEETKTVKQSPPQRTVSAPIRRKKSTPDKIVTSKKREVVRDSNEDIAAVRKSPPKPDTMNQTAFFS